jgi:hypothetical protein
VGEKSTGARFVAETTSSNLITVSALPSERRWRTDRRGRSLARNQTLQSPKPSGAPGAFNKPPGFGRRNGTNAQMRSPHQSFAEFHYARACCPAVSTLPSERRWRTDRRGRSLARNQTTQSPKLSGAPGASIGRQDLVAAGEQTLKCAPHISHSPSSITHERAAQRSVRYLPEPKVANGPPGLGTGSESSVEETFEIGGSD